MPGKAAAPEKARQKIVLMDSSKIGGIFPYKIGDLEEIDYLITDDTLPEDIRNIAEKHGVIVM